MQQIAEWLAKDWPGAEYASAFVENDIDISVLRYLTDADLEKNWRPRWDTGGKLLAAIAALARRRFGTACR